MEVVISPSPTTAFSSLDPNAPLFVPMSFRTVEDFSDQWWHLVHSSPCFRHYWLRECFQDPQALDDPLQDAFFDDQLLFQLYSQNAFEEEEESEKYHKELFTMGALKWRRDSSWTELPRSAITSEDHSAAEVGFPFGDPCSQPHLYRDTLISAFLSPLDVLTEFSNK